MKHKLSRPLLYHIIFESNTRYGKLFDIILLWIIAASVLIAMVDSISGLNESTYNLFSGAEWVFTILFTLEYITRIYVHPKPANYIFSFWGIIDLIAVFPAYLSLFIYGYNYLLVVRLLRLLRVFRVLRMVRFSKEANTLLRALKASLYKIGIFFLSVLCIVVILGTLLYVIEGPENGFSNIFQSIYWAIITITTVGYGDIVPQTVAGKFISSVAMIIGYAIIAVPTGIVTVEMARTAETTRKCQKCGHHNPPASQFCNKCGEQLPDKE